MCCKLFLCLIKPTLLNDVGGIDLFCFYLSARLCGPATISWDKLAVLVGYGDNCRKNLETVEEKVAGFVGNRKLVIELVF
jgi:hypothetical protein